MRKRRPATRRPRKPCPKCAGWWAITTKGTMVHHTLPSAYSSSGRRCDGVGKPHAPVLPTAQPPGPMEPLPDVKATRPRSCPGCRSLDGEHTDGPGCTLNQPDAGSYDDR